MPVSVEGELVLFPAVRAHQMDTGAMTPGSYSPKATAAARIHVRVSSDGISYDTVNLYSSDLPLTPGEMVSQTFLLDAKVMFIKVIVENLCKRHALGDISINATLGAN